MLMRFMIPIQEMIMKQQRHLKHNVKHVNHIVYIIYLRQHKNQSG